VIEASSAKKHVPGGAEALGTKTWRSRLEPGDVIVRDTLTWVHAVVSVKVLTREPTTVEPFISATLILIGAPAFCPCTQIEAVYVPAVVDVTQFGVSFRTHLRVPVDPLSRRAAPALPFRPGSMRVSVTPLPDPVTPHPAVSVSNPAFPTRLPDGGGGSEVTWICRVALSEPPPFVTVSLAVKVPDD
jgi:hypothetical protein